MICSKNKYQAISFLSTLYFSPISHQTQKKIKKLFEKCQKSLKYKGLRRFQGGIFFVKTSQKDKRYAKAYRLSFWRRYSFAKRGARSARGSNLKAKRKRLVIVFATLFATKQGADRAEQAQAIGCDYATGESCRRVCKRIFEPFPLVS